MKIKILNKKISKNILSIFIFSFILIITNQKAFGQGSGYPVIVEGIEPWVQFWVTNYGGTDSLYVQDTEATKILRKLASTTESLYLETLRNNYWNQDNPQIEDKNQGIEKNKINILTGELDKEVVKWMNQGFNQDNSSFISDADFYENARKGNVRDMVNSIELLSKDGLPSDQQYYKDILRAISANNGDTSKITEDFYPTIKEENDNGETASWDEWLGMTTDENKNPIIAYLSIQEALDSNITETQNKYFEEIKIGNGFLTYKECNVLYYDKNGNQTGKKDEPFYGDINYEKDIWEGVPEGNFPKVECKDVTPGNVISDKLNSISTSKDEILRMNAALSNGKDNVIDGIQGELKQLQNDILNKGILGTYTTSTEALNKKIEDNNKLLISTEGGVKKVSEDLSNPKNPNSPYNPKGILPGEEWKKIWGEKTDIPSWYDEEDYLFDWEWDIWDYADYL
ncbi:MAG: hypothetical protein WC827_02825 [Candidatus Paceibacterota bacterium]|jgi:hypothetical protein